MASSDTEEISTAAGNLFERERSVADVRESRLLPAGVPQRLVKMRYRIAAFLAQTPLFFVAVVIGIAVVFRLAIGVARSASADAADSNLPPHETPSFEPPSPTSPTPTPTATVSAEPGSESASTPGAPSARPLAPRRKARTHGLR